METLTSDPRGGCSTIATPADIDRSTDRREAAILRHTTLVRSIARRYVGRGLPFDDIVQCGYVGLINAVDRYDPSRGVPLRAFAARTIEGEIMHLFRDHGWAVRVPRSLQELSRRLTTVGERLGHTLGRTPTPEELAEAVDEPVEMVQSALMAQKAYTAESLADAGAESDDAGVDRILGIEDGGFDAVLDRDALARGLRRLPARERRMVALRFFEDMTQSEIADDVGISQMHVSRLLRAALETLRGELEGEGAAAG